MGPYVLKLRSHEGGQFTASWGTCSRSCALLRHSWGSAFVGAVGRRRISSRITIWKVIRSRRTRKMRTGQPQMSLAPAAFFDGSLLRGGFQRPYAALFEKAGQPGGGTPVGAAGFDDGEQRLRDGMQSRFGDLLGELHVAFH